MKSMKGIVFAFFLMAILLMPLVIAQPPFSVQVVTVTATRGIVILYPPNGILEQNKDYRFNFHLYNLTTGGFLDNSTISCYFHLYNETGRHIYEGVIPRENFDNDYRDYYVDIEGENFTTVGAYSYLIDCNASATVYGEGGGVKVGFEITRDGFPTDINNWDIAVIIGIIGIALLFIMLSFVFAREQKGIKTLLVMLALGCIVLVSGYIILMTDTGNPKDFSSYSLLNTALLTITIVVFWIFIIYYLIIYMKGALKALRESREGVTD